MSGPGDDERLSAYLDGQLNAAETAELEAQLAADPSLAAQLGAVLEVVVALRGLDEVDPPEEFFDRVRERVAEEQRGARVVLLPRRRSWAAIAASVAAAVFVTALAGTTVLQRRDLAIDGSRVEQAVRAQRLQSPLVADTAARLPDQAAAQTYFASQAPQSVPPEQAREAIATAPPFRSGVAPGACLDAVAPAGEGARVARVESVVYAGRSALVYVVRRGGPVQGEALVVDPATCEVRLAVPLE